MKLINRFILGVIMASTGFGAVGDLVKLPSSAQHVGGGNLLGAFVSGGANNFKHNPSIIAPAGKTIISYSHQFPFNQTLISSPNSFIQVGSLNGEIPLHKHLGIGVNFSYNTISSTADNQTINNNALYGNLGIRYSSYANKPNKINEKKLAQKMFNYSVGGSLAFYSDSIMGGRATSINNFFLLNLATTFYIRHLIISLSLTDISFPLLTNTSFSTVPTTIALGVQYLLKHKHSKHRIGLSGALDIDTHITSSIHLSYNFFLALNNYPHQKSRRFQLQGLDIGITYFILNFAQPSNIGGNLGILMGQPNYSIKLNYGIQYKLESGESHVITLGYHF